MNNKTDKWIDDVLGSMEDSRRASPNPNVLHKIHQEINAGQHASIVQMSQWRYAIAATLLILMMNLVAVQWYRSHNVGGATGQTAISDTYGTSLITSYQIYE